MCEGKEGSPVPMITCSNPEVSISCFNLMWVGEHCLTDTVVQREADVAPLYPSVIDCLLLQTNRGVDLSHLKDGSRSLRMGA